MQPATFLQLELKQGAVCTWYMTHVAVMTFTAFCWTLAILRIG